MIKTKILKFFGKTILYALAFAAFWLWSSAQVEKRVIAECELRHSQAVIEENKQEKEEAKNVEVKKAAIYSKPNAKRDSLLSKMRAGQL